MKSVLPGPVKDIDFPVLADLDWAIFGAAPVLVDPDALHGAPGFVGLLPPVPGDRVLDGVLTAVALAGGSSRAPVAVQVDDPYRAGVEALALGAAAHGAGQDTLSERAPRTSP